MSKYASFALVFAPFLFPYFLPGTTINLEVLFMLINGCVFTFYNYSHNNKAVWPRFFTVFVIYSFITPLFGFIKYGNGGAIKSTYVSFIPFLLCFVQLPSIIKWEYIKKYYCKLSYISISFFVVQEFMYYLLGWRLVGLLPFMPVSYSYTTMGAFIEVMSHLNRSMSFFLEPAHYAQYILGYLAVVLADNSKHGKLLSREAVVISLALLLTWSGTAILSTLLLWTILFFKLKIRKSIKYGLILPTVLLCACISFNYIRSTERGEEIMERKEEMSFQQSRVSSGMIRIFRGFLVYGDMPLDEKIFGVGTGTIPDVIDHSKFLFMFYDFDRYVNTAQAVLIGGGIVGASFFLLFLINMAKKKSAYPLFLVSLFIGLSFMEGFWLSGRMLLYLTIASYTAYYKLVHQKLISKINI